MNDTNSSSELEEKKGECALEKNGILDHLFLTPVYNQSKKKNESVYMNSLNFLREKPTENWIDYFVDPEKFLALLITKDGDQIASLMNQFVAQAQVADKENDARHKDLDLRLQPARRCTDEDFEYERRKSIRLWICAFACFASLGWNIEEARKYCNVLTIHMLLTRLITFTFSIQNTVVGDDFSKIIFGNGDGWRDATASSQKHFVLWLFARWVIHVDARNRMLDSVFKPTVSNPANQLDSNLVLADQLRSCIAEASIRQKSNEATILLEDMIKQDPNELIVPTETCFLELLKESDLICNLTPEIGFSIIPKLNFEADGFEVAESHWKRMTRYDLMCAYFAAGRLNDAKLHLCSIVADWASFKMSSSLIAKLSHIDYESLFGYCSAFAVDCPHFDTCLEQKDLRKVTSLSSIWLQSSDHSNFENILEEYLEGLPAPNNAVTQLLSSISDFDCIIKRLVETIRSPKEKQERRNLAKATLQYLALRDSTFSRKVFEVEKESGTTALWLQNKHISRKSVSRLPDASRVLAFIHTPQIFFQPNEFAVLLNGTVPFWRLLLSHGVTEIKLLLQQMGGKFTHPYRYEVSKVIGDAVLPKVMNSPNYEFIFLLLGKLESLAKIGDMQKMNSFCSDCVNELYNIGKEPEIKLRFTFDFVRVKLENWHEKTYKSTNNENVLRSTQDLQKTVKAIVQTALVKSSISALSKMMVHIVTFFINTNEWEYLMKCSDNFYETALDKSLCRLRSPFLDVAKVLAAFITADQARGKMIADGPWWQIMHPTFEDGSSKRRHDGSSAREFPKQLISRTDFLLLLKYIMEPRSIAFLLSFLGKVYNCVVSSLASSDGLSNVFIEHGHFWHLTPSSFANFNLAYICECLDVVLANALILNPINAFWLRSYADYNFVNERYEDALTLYMETCVACSESLIQPLPDNVVDDLMWAKVQRCLRYCGLETLAMIVCQQMRDPTEHYVHSAKMLLDSEGHTLDACDACFPLIMSVEVAEFLNDSYEKLGLSMKAQSLIKAIAVPELNSSNSNQSERYRRRERLMRLLCSRILQIHL